MFKASGRGAKTGDEDTQKVKLKGDTMEDREMSCSQLLVEEPRLEMKTHRRLSLKGTPIEDSRLTCIILAHLH